MPQPSPWGYLDLCWCRYELAGVMWAAQEEVEDLARSQSHILPDPSYKPSPPQKALLVLPPCASHPQPVQLNKSAHCRGSMWPPWACPHPCSGSVNIPWGASMPYGTFATLSGQWKWLAPVKESVKTILNSGEKNVLGQENWPAGSKTRTPGCHW